VDVISYDMTQRRKRNRSDSFPTIESVSSESQSITMKIVVVVQVNNKDNISLESNNSSTDFHGKMI
jgi:hypothetical protein